MRLASPGQQPRPRSRSTRSRRSRRVRRPAARRGAPALRQGSRFQRVAERARPQARLPLALSVLLGRRRHTATAVERACSNYESRLRRRRADAALRPVPSPRPSHAKRTPPPQCESSHLLAHRHDRSVDLSSSLVVRFQRPCTRRECSWGAGRGSCGPGRSAWWSWDRRAGRRSAHRAGSRRRRAWWSHRYV